MSRGGFSPPPDFESNIIAFKLMIESLGKYATKLNHSRFMKKPIGSLKSAPLMSRIGANLLNFLKKGWFPSSLGYDPLLVKWKLGCIGLKTFDQRHAQSFFCGQGFYTFFFQIQGRHRYYL